MPKQIHLKLPDELHQALRILAATSDTSIQDYVLEAVRQKIGQDKNKLAVASESVTRIAEEAAKYETSRD
jgi:plasmid stability protein